MSDSILYPSLDAVNKSSKAKAPTSNENKPVTKGATFQRIERICTDAKNDLARQGYTDSEITTGTYKGDNNRTSWFNISSDDTLIKAMGTLRKQAKNKDDTAQIANHGASAKLAILEKMAYVNLWNSVPYSVKQSGSDSEIKQYITCSGSELSPGKLLKDTGAGKFLNAARGTDVSGGIKGVFQRMKGDTLDKTSEKAEKYYTKATNEAQLQDLVGGDNTSSGDPAHAIDNYASFIGTAYLDFLRLYVSDSEDAQTLNSMRTNIEKIKGYKSAIDNLCGDDGMLEYIYKVAVLYYITTDTSDTKGLHRNMVGNSITQLVQDMTKTRHELKQSNVVMVFTKYDADDLRKKYMGGV